MEDRFLEIGKDFAQKIAEDNNIHLTEDLIKFCQKYKWDWFCADCSDDYSRTLSEQDVLKKSLYAYILECKG